MHRIYDGVYGACGVLAAISIAAMGILIIADVALRSLGAGSLRFSLEAVEYCILLAAFFGAPWVLKHNGHVTVDFIVRAMPPRGARALELVADILGLATTIIFLFYMARVGIASYEQGFRIIKSFIFPEWWLFAITCGCLFLIVVEFVLRMARTLSGRTADVPPAAL